MESNVQKFSRLSIRDLTDAEILTVNGGETSLSPEQVAAIKYKFREFNFSDVINYINRH